MVSNNRGTKVDKIHRHSIECEANMTDHKMSKERKGCQIDSELFFDDD